ncbi:MAG: right-handed parallel beta-helix repeat-containing protein [candidate division Zixibacteria bacterium]|nr:right-handed parallel beta-helix repeat-containing protein [candidate division Zixibacteria bacterium]
MQIRRGLAIVWMIAIALLAVISASVLGEETRVNDRFFIKFASIPPFDTDTGDVLEHDSLDSDVYDLLNDYNCDSLKKWYSVLQNCNMAQWYTAFHSGRPELGNLEDTMLALGAIETVDYYDTGCVCEETSWPPDDPDYKDNQEFLFRFLNLDSAHMIETGDTSIIIAIYAGDPYQWSHEDLKPNLWVHPGEDLNSNGTLEPWWDTLDSNGVYGDFDGLDNDSDGFIDNLIGGYYSLDDIKEAETVGHFHETPSAGVAAAVDNFKGGRGACPDCRLAGWSRHQDADSVPEMLIREGVRILNKSRVCRERSEDKLFNDFLEELADSNGTYCKSGGNYVGLACCSGAPTCVAGFGFADTVPDSNSLLVASYSTGHDVAFALPASDVYWTTRMQSGYGGFGGSSAASPMMAGIYGLMMSYDLHNDTIDWTIDSITNRLAASCTPIEPLLVNAPPEVIGGFGYGYPNVYQAMTVRGTYNAYRLSHQRLTLLDTLEAVKRPYWAGDSLTLVFGWKCDVKDLDSVRVTLISPDLTLDFIDATTLFEDVARSSVYEDTLSFVVPLSAEANEPYQLMLVMSGSDGYVDTISVPGIVLCPRPEYSVTDLTTSPTQIPPPFYAYPTAANVDADASLEVLFYKTDSLYCLDLGTGVAETGFPKYCDIVPSQTNGIVSPALGDLDGDGAMDILYSPSEYSITVVDGDGSALTGWSTKTFSARHLCSPVISDLDMDGSLDVILVTGDSLHCFDNQGNAVSGFPKATAGYAPKTSPSVGDLDGDGFPELAFVSDGGLEIFDALCDTSRYINTDFSGNRNTKMGDINIDGRLELLVPDVFPDSTLGHLVVVAYDADSGFTTKDTLLYGSPTRPFLPRNNDTCGFDGYSLADVTGNGFPNATAINNLEVEYASYADCWMYFDSAGGQQTLLDNQEFLKSFNHFQQNDLTEHSMSHVTYCNLDGDSDMDMLYSCVGGHYLYGHNIDGDPLFGNSLRVVFDFRSQQAPFMSGGQYLHTPVMGTAVVPDGNKTWIITSDECRWTVGTDMHRSASVRCLQLDYANPKQEWPLYRHDTYMTGCYRQPWMGVIDTNITWRDTVYLYGDLTISGGDTLTVKAGTVVLSHDDDFGRAGGDTTKVELTVQGHLSIEGTSSNHIVFSSLDGTAGDWYGIVVDSGSISMNYVDIKYAYAGVYDKGSSTDTILNCVISNSDVYGIRTENSDLLIKNTTVKDMTTGYGIYVDSCQPSLVDDSVIACEEGIYLKRSKMTLEDCVIVGPGATGVHVWATSDSAAHLTDLEITGSFTRHIYLDATSAEINNCVIASPTDSTRSDYGILASLTYDVKLRETAIHNYDAAGIYAGFCIFQGESDEWNLGDYDTTQGTHGNNSIHTDDEPSYAVDGPTSGPNLLAHGNYWVTCPHEDTTLYRLAGTYIVSDSACLETDPHAPAGKAQVTGELANLPMRFELYPNYPNPFNPSTTIRFDLPKTTDVHLVVYNLLGQKVITLKDGVMPAGWHSVVWNGRSGGGKPVASGVYFYRIETDFDVSSKKMMLIK